MLKAKPWSSRVRARPPGSDSRSNIVTCAPARAANAAAASPPMPPPTIATLAACAMCLSPRKRPLDCFTSTPTGLLQTDHQSRRPCRSEGIHGSALLPAVPPIKATGFQSAADDLAKLVAAGRHPRPARGAVERGDLQYLDKQPAALQLGRSRPARACRL
jgi:hypothetical protein